MFLAFNVIKAIAEGVSTFFIEDPGIFLVDFIAVHLGQILDAWVLAIFGTSKATKGEENAAKPDFLHVSLVIILSDDLFYGKKLAAFLMLAEPDETKTTSSE